MSSRTRHRRRGHTLVEVLVVLAILGITLVAVAPALRATEQGGARQATDELLAQLSRARATAVEQGAVTTLILDPATRQTWLAVGDAAPIRVGAPVPAPGTVAVVGTAPRMRYVFLPTGMAFGDPLVIRDDARAMLVRVDRWTGAIDVETR